MPSVYLVPEVQPRLLMLDAATIVSVLNLGLKAFQRGVSIGGCICTMS
jgi:hypothetical protein